jgi:hypothetical protein
MSYMSRDRKDRQRETPRRLTDTMLLEAEARYRQDEHVIRWSREHKPVRESVQETPTTAESDSSMPYTPEDRISDEEVRRLSTDEDPRGSQHREYVYSVELRPKYAKTRDREKEEALRLKMLSYEQASD